MEAKKRTPPESIWRKTLDRYSCLTSALLENPRRAAAAGVKIRIGNHTLRATGITAYLKNSGKLEIAQHIANHESPPTTKLYDRRQEEISLDEVERTAIGDASPPSQIVHY